MARASQILTFLSVAAFVVGISWWALAATCAGSLPPSGAVAGWTTVANSTLSGRMGGDASYRAYDGAVEAMRAEGVRAFAQRVYRHSTTGQYLTLDVYQLTSRAEAAALYAKKQRGYSKAKPLTNYTDIQETAFIGTLGGMSFGVVRRGPFVAEVSVARGATARDRTAVRAFLRYVSQKLSE